ncbi:MAG: HDOD domain-containing protein [Planctomycetota bacterium]
MTLTAPAETSAIDQIVQRAAAIYTLPAVAAEVIELTSDPTVDNRALKDCIERDPALAAKVLRVVNSSLFGLNGKVGDLNQALAMLGIKPLKLLALGFTLPEALFLDVARAQLDWYWQTTLSRAVAAREIAEHLFDMPGDDAFLTGLLQDIGVLVLLGQLGKPYADFLAEAIAERTDLHRVEVATMGFDHTELSARLLASWNMPARMVRAIAEPRQVRRLAKNQDEHACLARIVHLAELLAQLVAQRRLRALPDLLEAGHAYTEMDKDDLERLVRGLDPKVRQLGDVLAIPSNPEADYLKTLTEAHRLLSELTDPLANLAPRPGGDGGLISGVAMASAAALTRAVAIQSESPPSPVEVEATTVDDPQRAKDLTTPFAEATAGTLHDAQQPMSSDHEDATWRRLAMAVGYARSQRDWLSVAIVGVGAAEPLEGRAARCTRQLLQAVCRRDLDPEHGVVELSPTRAMLILPGCERRQAVGLAAEIAGQLQTAASHLLESLKLPRCVVAAGVASVDTPLKNFAPRVLATTAERCFSAALAAGGTMVKSLEVN